MKCNTEKPDAPPVIYVKLKTAYGKDPAKIVTPFYRKATGKNIVNIKGPGRNAPSSDV